MLRIALLALALSSCSLIGTRRPDPPPYAERPTCNASYARPAWDTVFAVGAAGLAGVGVVSVAQGNDPQANNLGPAVASIVVGGALAALFTTSAVIGYPRVATCSEALADWRGRHPEEEIIPERGQPEHRIAKAAREMLPCPVGELAVENLSFSRNDGRCDPYRWASVEVRGCGLAIWCGEPDDRVKCGATPDLDLVMRRVAAETGCPQDKITALARVAEVQMGRRGADGLVTHRLDACGQVYACSVPMTVGDKNDTLFPDLSPSANFSCRAVQIAAPPPPPPPLQ
jgi:hypothetical protein